MAEWADLALPLARAKAMMPDLGLGTDDADIVDADYQRALTASIAVDRPQLAEEAGGEVVVDRAGLVDGVGNAARRAFETNGGHGFAKLQPVLGLGDHRREVVAGKTCSTWNGGDSIGEQSIRIGIWWNEHTVCSS